MATQDEPDEFVEECLDSWTPRFIENGVDYNDLQRLQGTIEGWDDWCPSFRAVGDRHAALGETALEADNVESAADHFVDASMCYHFGSHVWHEDDAYRDETHGLAVDMFRKAGPHLDPPLQRLEAPTGEGFSIPGNLRVPETTGDEVPLVVLLPGLDSIKEELTTYDSVFHQRGMATLAVDGPAQGETWFNHRMTGEYHRYISAMVDHVTELDPEGVDTTRLGVMGVSLGGYYAPHCAANDDRFDACVGLSGPFLVGPVSKNSSNLHQEQFLWACHTDSMVEADEITESMSLRDDIDDLTVPSLMVTGANDSIVRPTETERIASRAPGGEYLLYEEGNHVCTNVSFKYKPRVADWLRGHLT